MKNVIRKLDEAAKCVDVIETNPKALLLWSRIVGFRVLSTPSLIDLYEDVGK